MVDVMIHNVETITLEYRDLDGGEFGGPFRTASLTFYDDEGKRVAYVTAFVQSGFDLIKQLVNTARHS